jgi:hypothetical protein
MLPSFIRGAVVAGAAALVAAMPSTFGLTSVWPVLLVAAVAFARPLRPGPVLAVMIGAMSWWIGMALRAAVLPDATSSLVIAAVVAVGICTVAAAVSRERLPLWAGLIGIALFGAIYEPSFAAEPTMFLSQSVLALASVVVAIGLGTLAAIAADLVAGTSLPRPRTSKAPTTEGVA